MLINISTTLVLILRKLVALPKSDVFVILAFPAYWFLYSFDIQFQDIYLLIWSICKKGHKACIYLNQVNKECSIESSLQYLHFFVLIGYPWST
jgi:hypothetical protein